MYDLESAVMSLIVEAGNARGAAFSALEKAKQKQFDEADSLLKQAEESMTKAHNQQTQLLSAEANGTIDQVNLLTVHAQDHLMTAILAIELIQEIIDLRKER